MKYCLSLLAMIVALNSCTKCHDGGNNNGIQDDITTFSTTACPGGTVTRYDYDGMRIYLFADNCPIADGQSKVTDDQGNPICWLGGIAGVTKCQGKDFEKTAKNPVVVYTK